MTKIEQLSFDAQRGWGSLYYHVLPKIINEKGYKIGIEIGVAFGGHAENLLKNTFIEKLVGIDPYKDYHGGFGELKGDEDYNDLYLFTMNRLKGDRYLHIRDNSDKALEILKGKKYPKEYDFIFIDGLHEYDAVKFETEAYSKLIRKDGIVSGHDYNHISFPGVTRAVNEFADKYKKKVQVLDGYVWLIEW